MSRCNKCEPIGRYLGVKDYKILFKCDKRK